MLRFQLHHPLQKTYRQLVIVVLEGLLRRFVQIVSRFVGAHPSRSRRLVVQRDLLRLVGRYQPHAASEVLSNSYGDCKDKNTLLAALLAAEGFQATSVLIGSQHELDPEIPSPSQFDHVITRVPINGNDIWLDSTNGVAPFRMLSAPLRKKEGLAIPPDGKASLAWTPADLPFEAFD